MIIKPFESVGDLSFGDSRQEIIKKLNEPFESGIKQFGSVKDYYDFFTKSQLFVYYDENDKINAFEFFEPNPKYNDLDLLRTSYMNLVRVFKDLDVDLIIEYNGFTSNKYGIGGNTNDDPENVNSFPEAIILFKKGYYNL